MNIILLYVLRDSHVSQTIYIVCPCSTRKQYPQGKYVLGNGYRKKCLPIRCTNKHFCLFDVVIIE